MVSWVQAQSGSTVQAGRSAKGEPVLDIRPAVGVALLMSVGVLVTSGFVAQSSREVTLIMAGFAMGLLAAWLVDWAHQVRARRERRPDGQPPYEPTPAGRHLAEPH